MPTPRLSLLAAALFGAAAVFRPEGCAAESPAPFNYAALRAQAAALAQRDYLPSRSVTAKLLRELDYDQVQGLRFDPAHTIWAQDALPFRLRFFHPGGIFLKTVRVHEWQDGTVREFPFSPQQFRYPAGIDSAALPPDLGYTGVQLHVDGNFPDGELGAFLGASYFRLVCENSHYGLSARGLALDSGGAGPEEFPDFTAFWVKRPQPGDRKLTLLALLDSPSVTGAYQFELTPGADSLAHVRAEVFARRTIRVLGFAPLTSMFQHGEGPRPAIPDFRPEVHDSDGLLLHTEAGEWLWRPVTNPRKVRLVTFGGARPRGFGFLQRDREFSHYEDLDACYHQRPGAWVEPRGDWGEGEIRLLELPSNNEYADNLVAFWRPRSPLLAGKSATIEYVIHWSLGEPANGPRGRTLSTKVGATGDSSGYQRCVIEFDGPELQALAADAGVEAQVTIGSNAKSGHHLVTKNRFNGAWRAVFDFKPEKPTEDVELRCYLRRGDTALTETWSYLWSP